MPAFQPSARDAANSDRRGALRHPVRVQGELSTDPTCPTTVVLTDISEQGCRVIRPVGLTAETSLSLSFGGFMPFYASVVWTTPKAAGLRFDHPIHPALIAQVVAAAKGRKRSHSLLAAGLVRREERERLWHLKRPVQLDVARPEDTSGTMLAGELSDLSTAGCRIASDVALLPGTPLTVAIEGREPLAGVVRWCGDQAIGIQFRTPIPSRTIESIADPR